MSDGQTVQIAGVPPVQPPVEVQAPPAAGNGQQTGNIDIEKLTAEITAKVAEQMKPALEAQFKSQLDGTNRRNSELEKQLEEQAKKANEQKLTDSERIAAIEEREATAQREREAERRDAEKAVKIATWKSEAVARGLPDDTYVDSTLSLEDGIKYLEGYQAKVQEKITAGINAKLSQSTLPGSGNVGDAAVDTKNWTGPQWADFYAQKNKARAVGNPMPPGVVGATIVRAG